MRVFYTRLHEGHFTHGVSFIIWLASKTCTMHPSSGKSAEAQRGLGSLPRATQAAWLSQTSPGACHINRPQGGFWGQAAGKRKWRIWSCLREITQGALSQESFSDDEVLIPAGAVFSRREQEALFQGRGHPRMALPSPVTLSPELGSPWVEWSLHCLQEPSPSGRLGGAFS